MLNALNIINILNNIIIDLNFFVIALESERNSQHCITSNYIGEQYMALGNIESHKTTLSCIRLRHDTFH